MLHSYSNGTNLNRIFYNLLIKSNHLRIFSITDALPVEIITLQKCYLLNIKKLLSMFGWCAKITVLLSLRHIFATLNNENKLHIIKIFQSHSIKIVESSSWANVHDEAKIKVLPSFDKR